MSKFKEGDIVEVRMPNSSQMTVCRVIGFHGDMKLYRVQNIEDDCKKEKAKSEVILRESWACPPAYMQLHDTLNCKTCSKIRNTQRLERLLYRMERFNRIKDTDIEFLTKAIRALQKRVNELSAKRTIEWLD